MTKISITKPQLVAGTRDLAPDEVLRRNYIFDTIRKIYTLYGYEPLETPAMERIETLTGKYGTEGDTLLYKILNSGDYLSKVSPEELAEGNSQKMMGKLVEKGLRYDLTVPFARFVTMNRHTLAFPFKRYQIQPVWRAERNQRGRYREFFQCDADVVGSDSLVYEAELMQVFDKVFAELGLKVVIRFNNRKLLDGLAQLINRAEDFMQITVIIDKLDKIGWDGIATALAKIGLTTAEFEQVKAVLTAKKLSEIEALMGHIPVAAKGIEEIQNVLNFNKIYSFSNRFELDFSLARGLNYYTGSIYEVVADTTAAGQEQLVMGSIASGGRYDNLTAIFGLPDVSGVGISFGADRIFDLLGDMNLYPASAVSRTQVLCLSLDDDALPVAFSATLALREAGISADCYPQVAKFKKQMEYANRRQSPFIIIIGEEERTSGLLGFKNMTTGEQEKLNIEAIIERLLAGN
jgi:histidyl-tRNA synthetase